MTSQIYNIDNKDTAPEIIKELLEIEPDSVYFLNLNEINSHPDHKLDRETIIKELIKNGMDGISCHCGCIKINKV